MFFQDRFHLRDGGVDSTGGESGGDRRGLCLGLGSMDDLEENFDDDPAFGLLFAPDGLSRDLFPASCDLRFRLAPSLADVEEVSGQLDASNLLLFDEVQEGVVDADPKAELELGVG